MASGQVQLDGIDALKANIASRDVTIGHIDGAAFAMRIGEVNGTVGLSNSGGQVWIGHAAADLDLGSASCDVDGADGSVTASTSSGAIRIGRMTNGQAKRTNTSGNIEVGIGEGTAASTGVPPRGALRPAAADHDDRKRGGVQRGSTQPGVQVPAASWPAAVAARWARREASAGWGLSRCQRNECG